jgi:hypothetical protein
MQGPAARQFHDDLAAGGKALSVTNTREDEGPKTASHR